MIETSLPAGSPEPESVYGVPGTPISGFALRIVMFAAGFDGAARGPGSCAIPGIAGAVSGLGSAEACAGRSSTPASAETMQMSFLVLIGCSLSHPYGMIVIW